LLKRLSKCLIKDQEFSIIENDADAFADFKFIPKKLVTEKDFIHNFQDILDFDSPIINTDFSVKLSLVDTETKVAAKKLIIKLCELI
ncbi:hypothetical protein Q0N28_14610, partial [Staphylococcus aureus]|nr:hypothetical protein [Staphylococcus aureus]